MLLQDALESLKFLTIVPLPQADYKNINWQNVVALFPLAGLFIGICLYTTAFIFPPPIYAFVCLLLWILTTGGFHLDGLADSMDALCLGKSPTERLSIMKDPQIGSFGVISIVLTVSGKLWLLGNVSPSKLLIIPPIIGRWALYFIPLFFPSAKEEGLGHFVKKNIEQKKIFLSSLFVWLLTVILWNPTKGIVSFLTISTFLLLYGFLWNKKLGGFTGDTLGSACEITEVITLLLICLLK